MKRIVIAVLVLSSATLTFAQQRDVEGSKDHPLISRYRGSVITEYSAVEFDEYTLPLGKIQDSQFAKSQHLEGKVTRIHYEIPEQRSALEVMRNYEQAPGRAGFQTLCS